MIQIATDPSQSARLKACGVNPKSADMSYIVFQNGQVQYHVGNVEIQAGRIVIDGTTVSENENLIGQPAWSLSALLSMLPPTISIDEDEYSEPIDYDLFIYPSITGKVWSVSYAYTEDGYSDELYESGNSSVIEAVVKMIETLVSHKRKLNEIKQ